MRIERVEAARPLRWRKGRTRPALRLWLPVTDSWIGTGDDRLWAASDRLDSEAEGWMDGLWT